MNSKIVKVEASKHVEESYMRYAMTTIIDRVLPDVRDGLKPVHRRILWAMKKKGLTYDKPRAKSSEPVSETMKIHHHGDSSIYEALCLMTEDNGDLLYPFIDGEGSFGKVYSSDSPSAMRYTSCRLNKFSNEFFNDINKNIVTMIGEYKEHLQPVVLPTTYPSILIKPNKGIAVGEACSFGSFNFSEVIDATILYLENKSIDLIEIIKAPDFSSGGQLIFNECELKKIYETGKGRVLLRGKYEYDKENNCIDIYEIPYSTTVEKIVQRISELMKTAEFKNITDVRDETGYNKEKNTDELRITIDVKKNTNVELLMSKLFKKSPLESYFSFNMNCLVNFEPKVLGIKDILNEWINFRIDCIRKATLFDIESKRKELHVLLGLEKVLLDIDKAVEIIRNSKEENMIDDLISYFNIDKIQANYVSNIKLRNINKEYIIRQIKDINLLKEELENLITISNDDTKIKQIIKKQLIELKNKYAKSRKTEIVYEDKVKEIAADEFIEDYSCNIIYTKENYLKKTLRYSESQKVKDGDEIVSMIQTSNKGEVILFSNKQNAYKLQINDLENKQPSALGLYIPSLINIGKNENIIGCVATNNYKGFAIITYENGKIHKLPLESFRTNTKRSMLKNTLINSPIVSIIQIEEDADIYLESSQNKALVINTENINEKASRNSQGIQIMHSNKGGFRVIKAELYKNQVSYDDYIVTKKSAGRPI
ncbi:TPA: DNA gyrase subunit A [Clostridium perfringens]